MSVVKISASLKNKVEKTDTALGALVLVGLAFFVFVSATPPPDNLHKFHDLIQQDPLFFDPAMNIELLREAVADMRHTDDLILYVDHMVRPLDPKYSDVFPEHWRLWPDDFLGTLPDIHTATADFLASPTPEKAQYLLSLYRTAAAAYRAAIDLHIRAMDAIFEKNPKLRNTTIAFLGSGTTPEIVYNDFLLIRRNADALDREIERRETCLNGGECEVREGIKDGTNNKHGSEKVPIHPAPIDMLPIEQNKPVTGPYWAETSCFGFAKNNGAYQHSFYVATLKKDRYSNIISPILTNTALYRDFTDAPDIAHAKIHTDLGILYEPQYSTADYLCTDLTYLTEILSQYIYDKNVGGNDPKLHSLAALPFLMRRSAATNSMIFLPLAIKQVQTLGLLINRSAYSLYFGTFSQTIWREERLPQFLLPYSVPVSRGYIDYDGLRKKGLSTQEIRDIKDEPSRFEVYREVIREKNENYK